MREKEYLTFSVIEPRFLSPFPTAMASFGVSERFGEVSAPPAESDDGFPISLQTKHPFTEWDFSRVAKVSFKVSCSARRKGLEVSTQERPRPKFLLTLVASSGDTDVRRVPLQQVRRHHMDILVLFISSAAHQAPMPGQCIAALALLFDFF